MTNLAPGTYTLPAGSTIVVPQAVVTPPPATASWIYHNGQYFWGTDWSSGGTANYSDTSGAPVSGTKDIAFTTSAQWGLWTPVAPNNAAGIPAFDASPYTHLTLSLKPTRAVQVWSLYAVPGPDGETFVPGTVVDDISVYGPAPAIGKWGTYLIPLSVLGVGKGLAVGTNLRKLGLQDQSGPAGNAFFIDAVGFS